MKDKLMLRLPKSIQLTVQYLKEQLGDAGVIVLFGSRARGKGTDGADFDIGVTLPSGTSWKTFSVWKTKAEDLAWPYRIDLVNLTQAPQEFLEIVQKEMIVLHGVLDGRHFVTTETRRG